jgi:hypothetical protein
MNSIGEMGLQSLKSKLTQQNPSISKEALEILDFKGEEIAFTEIQTALKKSNSEISSNLSFG